MYRLLIEKQVEKQLEKIPEPDYTRVRNCILGLAQNPRPAGCKKMRGRVGYRIRQGDYRIIYDINDRMLTVLILAAGNKKDVYD